MEDQSLSTPHTVTDASTPKASAPKDKNCPYCHQTFTSSSLGRHLDLYIRAKNPKALDGIHNVEEIRRLRQGITRRQARMSSAQRDVSTPGSAAKQPANDSGSSMAVRTPPINGVPGDKVRMRLNEPIWQATGVINNLPPRPVSTVPDVRRGAARQQQLKAGLEQRQRLIEDLDNAKAAELALKEVLASVKEASARVASVPFFDFDPYTLNFPSLCLRILPPPPTLFSPTPFPTSESWSINPPGQKQLEALNRLVQNRLVTRTHQSHPHSTSAHAMPGQPSPALFEPEAQKLQNHFAEAFSHWKTLSEKQRYETWQLEVLRLYTRAEESRSKMEEDLEAARREIEQLHMQLEKANTSWMGLQQFPPPYSIHTPPPSLNLTPDTIKQLSKRNVDMSSWDYDRLIEKWRIKVRAERQEANGLGAQRSLSGSSQQSTIINSGAGTCQIPTAMNNHVTPTNGPYAHPSNPPTAYPPFSGAQRTDSLVTDPTDHTAGSGGANSDDDADADADVNVDIDGVGNTPATSMPDALPSPHVSLPTQQHQQQQMAAWGRGSRHVNHARGFMPHMLPSNKLGGMKGPAEGFMGGGMGLGMGMGMGMGVGVGVRPEGG